MRHQISRRLAIGVAVAALALGVPLGVLASHQFTDVPNSHPFHADIDALYDSGVTTTGCGGGKFCPDQYVTRGQMAAFLNRLGALADSKVPVVNADRVDGLESSAFARPMFAVVNTDGTLARGYGVSTTLKQSTGSYRVTWNRDIDTCAFFGTLGNAGGGFPPIGIIGITFSDTAQLDDIYIETRDAAGASADASFHVQAVCTAAEGDITGAGASDSTDGGAKNDE